MKKIHVSACVIALVLGTPTLAAENNGLHPLMTSKYWTNVGIYFSARDLKASANGSIAGITKSIDFDSNAGLDDRPDLFMAEFGWQFSSNWGIALQYFESDRSASRALSESIEWQDLVFDVGVQVEAATSMEIVRLFFARQFRDRGPHSLRLGAGIHWFSVGASLAGEATLNDLSTEFRRSTVTADVPMPNIGAWYRYSPSRKWMFNARVDWLSASIDKYSGRIWNASGGVVYSPWDHVGLGLSYQFFEVDGRLSEDRWRGEIRTQFTGPFVFVSGHW